LPQRSGSCASAHQPSSAAGKSRRPRATCRRRTSSRRRRPPMSPAFACPHDKRSSNDEQAFQMSSSVAGGRSPHADPRTSDVGCQRQETASSLRACQPVGRRRDAKSRVPGGALTPFVVSARTPARSRATAS
jgi:hypothetical protein